MVAQPSKQTQQTLFLLWSISAEQLPPPPPHSSFIHTIGSTADWSAPVLDTQGDIAQAELIDERLNNSGVIFGKVREVGVGK